MRKRLGFTLAEVLITLGIIGIVAEMTIPILMSNVQDAQFKGQMRKDYSVLSQAFGLVQNDNGGSFIAALGNCTDGDHSCFKNTFKSKLSYIKECEASGNLGVCFPALAKIKYLNGSYASGDGHIGNASAGLVLKDGSSLGFYLDSALCKAPYSPNYTDRCGWITVDVNGVKPPNTWGKDIYIFFVFSNAMRPSAVGITESWVASADDCGVGTNRGDTCSSKYLLGQ